MKLMAHFGEANSDLYDRNEYFVRYSKNKKQKYYNG